MNSKIIFFITFFATAAWAGPQYLTYEGYVTDSGGVPLNGSVGFRFSVMDSAGSCSIYIETQNVTVNNGAFTTLVGPGGSGAQSFPGGLSDFGSLFSNRSLISGSSCSIPGGASENRLLRAEIWDGSAYQLVANYQLSGAPQALNSDKLQGYGSGEFLKIQNGAQGSALTAPQVTNLMDLINGTSTQYVSSSSPTFTSAPSYGSAPSSASHLTNKQYVDDAITAVNTTVSGKVNSVGGTAPISIGGTATNPIVSMPVASSSANGYLSSTDWNTFNGKLNASALTNYFLNGGNNFGVAASIGTMDNFPLELKTNNTMQLYISNNGRIGVGTTAPATLLSNVSTVTTDNLGQTANSSGLHWRTNASGNTATFANSAIVAGGNGVSIVTADASSSSYGLHVVSNNISRFIVRSDGNVGVGTNSPNSLLTVEGATSLRELAASPSSTINYGKLYVKTDGNLYYQNDIGTEFNLLTPPPATSVLAGSGSSVSPSISFGGDFDTGFYNNGANTIGIASGGANVFNISSTSLSSPTAGGALISSANGTPAAPTFSFAGDTNTGWFSPGADMLAASTGGTERITINSIGDVGIGITNPSYKLHVVSALSNTGDGLLSQTNSTLNSGQESAAVRAFNTNTGGTAGAVGVYGAKSVAHNYAPSTGGVYGARNEAIQQNSGSASSVGGSHNRGVNAGASSLGQVFGALNETTISGSGTVTSAYGTKSMIDQSAGSITAAYGIHTQVTGTATPITSYGLYLGTINGSTRYSIYQSDVNAKNYLSAPLLLGATASPTPTTWINIQGPTNPEIKISKDGVVRGRLGLATIGGNISANSIADSFILANDNGAVHLGTGTGTSSVQMTVQTDGKVGIGNPNPGARLHVRGDTSTPAEPVLVIESPNRGVNAVLSASNPTNQNGLYIATTSSYPLMFGTNGIERMVIDGGGNVGIGTAPAGDKFTVFTGSSTGTYGIGGWTHTSDRRMKRDIASLENSLEKITQLRGVRYKFIKDSENKNQLGFIAQEVEPIFPEVVQTDKKGIKSMVYANLVAPVVEAIKELSQWNRNLESEIESLKKENAELKAYLCSQNPTAPICK